MRLPFGKYKGHTDMYIAAIDPSYLGWFVSNVKNVKISDGAKKMLRKTYIARVRSMKTYPKAYKRFRKYWIEWAMWGLDEKTK